jgi:hypothetical protein
MILSSLSLGVSDQKNEEFIYLYNFNGPAGDNLVDKKIQSKNSNQSFISNDSSDQLNMTKSNGSMVGNGSPSYYLPFRVTARKKNIISSKIELAPNTPPSQDWFGLCFARGDNLPSMNSSLASAYSAIFLLRENGNAQLLSWAGVEGANTEINLGRTSGEIKIILNNTHDDSDLWTIEYFFNDNLLHSTQFAGGNYNPDAYDPIRWVGFGKYGSVQGNIKYFGVKKHPIIDRKEIVDSKSITNKIICGYQGWFSAPIAGDPRWIHWGGTRGEIDHASPDGTNLLIDMYPDMREFDSDELYSTAMTLGGVAPAPLYSSSNSKTINRHFKWMQDYSIDGIFIQRFIKEHMSNDLSYQRQLNKTLWNAKDSAAEHGRVFAVMYDVSNCIDGDNWINFLKYDWMSLVDQGLIDGDRYLNHKDKPLVGIWGMGFTDRVPSDSSIALELINWFKINAPEKYRASVYGGIPGQWRTLNGDSRTQIEWTSVYQAYDIISPWTVGRYTNDSEIDNWKNSRIGPDISAKVIGQEYSTVVWPGFSWKNLNNNILNQIPRNGGAFYWRQIYNACESNSSMLYIAMFDEVNEGTAIYKTAENSSQSPDQGDWLNLNADGIEVASDWYLRLTCEAGKMLKKTSTLSSVLPVNPMG